MKNILILLCFFLGSLTSQSQDLNDYKYVIVPQEYEFLNGKNYQLNALTKFLFEKYGFKAYIQGEEIPEELGRNRCDGLFADIDDNSGMLRTKLVVTLKDCNNKLVFQSEEGVTNEKDYKKAYHEALREAFKSIAGLKYEYNETIVTGRPIVNSTPAKETRTDSNKDPSTIPDPSTKKQTSKMDEEEVTGKTFFRENFKFYLKENKNGYSIFQEGMTEPFAALIKSSAGNFIYSSISSKGVAYFDESGNLIIEILNPDSNTLDSIVYKIQP